MRKLYGAAGLVLLGGVAIGSLTGGRAAHAAGSQTVTPALGISVTPGWECIPTTAGQPVLSGGTGAFPSCGDSTTPVLAPTYVASGVGGRHTVVFSSVNVQVVSGSGSTDGAVNGTGNLVVGYAENTKGFSQTGSNNLVVGSNNGWSSYGGILGGYSNQVLSRYSTVVGADNSASGGGGYNLVAGYNNKGTGEFATATGGRFNTAKNTSASILGGDGNSTSASCQAIPAAPGTC